MSTTLPRPATAETTAHQPPALLTPADLHRLEHLRLTPDRRFAGRVRGERISRQKGISIEFSDFRSYAPGDDLRHLDWSILARLDRPTIRTYQDEDDLAVYLVLDASASMDFGSPTKWRVAQAVAAAVGFVGLIGQDSVYPILLDNRVARGHALRGRASLGALTRWANSAQPRGAGTGFAASLSQIARAPQMRQGMAVCVTDALDPAAPAALRALASRGHQIVMVQILSPIEIDPELEGDLRLMDSENGDIVEITAHAEALRLYRQNLQAHCAAVEEEVTRTGGRYLRCTADSEALDTVIHGLRRLGVLE